MKVLTNLEDRVRVVQDGWSSLNAIWDTASLRQEEAFYIFDVDDVVNKYRRWMQKMPRVEPHYAVKCNDLQIVLEVLAALGVGFDCASKTEINKILDLGVNPERIIFANPAKPASHIRYALANGVHTMTFDSEFELLKIKQMHPRANLVIRIRCDAKVAQCPLGFKFGCDPVTEAPRLLKQARLLGLDVVGVSFHVGSGCGEPDVFSRAIEHAADLFILGEMIGHRMDLLDIGGGFPGGSGTSIDDIASVVTDALDRHFPEGCGVRIIAEPGRYFVASAFTLACCVYAKRQLYDEEGDIRHVMYFLNDGVYGSFNCILYDHQQVTAVPLKGSTGKVMSSSLWGPTCDSMDQIAKDILLPNIEIGDWIVFKDMGAYTIPVASPFNGFPVPRVTAYISSDSWRQLKEFSPLTEEHFIGGETAQEVECLLSNSLELTPAISVSLD